PPSKPQRQSHRQAETTPRRDLSECFYTPSWRRSTQPAGPSNSKLGSSGWGVVLDRLGVGERVASEFRQSGLRVVAVERGSEFRKIDDDNYAIHPSQPKDYDCLLKELGNDGEPIRQFLHCWCVENPEPGTARLDRLETVQALSFHSLLYLA